MQSICHECLFSFCEQALLLFHTKLKLETGMYWLLTQVLGVFTRNIFKISLSSQQIKHFEILNYVYVDAVVCNV